MRLLYLCCGMLMFSLAGVVLVGCGGGGGSSNSVPTAAFTYATDSLTVNVDAGGSTDAEDGENLQFAWDWGDGQSTPFGTAKIASHTYAAAGTYMITLTVRDTAGAMVNTLQQVTVNIGNSSPTASFTVTPSSGNTDTLFQFNASGSSDAEDSTAILQVRWDWENNGIWDTSWSTTKSANHSYLVPGTYTVLLQVKDSGSLTAVETQSVQVLAGGTAPTASFTLTPSSGTTSTIFNVDASGSSDPEDASAELTVRWDWENDGTWDTAYSTTKTASHNYPSPATYTMKLEVKDTSGLTDATTRSVNVTSNVAVTLDPQTLTIAAGKTKQFDATVMGTTNTTLNWSARDASDNPVTGVITAGGLLTAPSTYGKYYITTTSDADPTKSATASVYVVAPELISFIRETIGAHGNTSDLYTMEPDGSNLTLVQEDVGYASLSPDGRAVACTSYDSYIYLRYIDGSNTVPFNSFGRGNSPSFSPDGKSIVYVDIDRNLCTRNIDGTNLHVYTGVKAASPSYSHDGRTILMISSPGTVNDIYTMDIATGALHNITQTPKIQEYMPAFSPDDARIAFRADNWDNSALTGLYIMNSDGTNPQRLTNGGHAGVTFSPDGKTLLYSFAYLLNCWLYFYDLGGGLSGSATTGEYDFTPSWRGWTDTTVSQPAVRRKRK